MECVLLVLLAVTVPTLVSTDHNQVYISILKIKKLLVVLAS